MLCTRCQQREAIGGPSPEARAKGAEIFGAPWPFPDDICADCIVAFAKTPEYRARLDTFSKAAGVKFRESVDKAIRSAALEVLDFADRIAGKI